MFHQVHVLRLLLLLTNTVDTFRFEYENDFDLKFFTRIVKKYTPRNPSLYFFSPEKLALLSLVKEVEPSPDCKRLKLLTFGNLFPPL